MTTKRNTKVKTQLIGRATHCYNGTVITSGIAAVAREAQDNNKGHIGCGMVD